MKKIKILENQKKKIDNLENENIEIKLEKILKSDEYFKKTQKLEKKID